MRIETKKVRESTEMVGQIVWICDYRQPDLGKKAARHVPPTRVKILDTDNLPKNKKVYYSHTYFSPVNDDGKILKKVISPVDNTGYRMHHGVELNVFDSEVQCKQHYRAQCDDIISRLEKKELTAVEEIRAKINKIRKEKADNFQL